MTTLQAFIGTKRINAQPMNRGDYNKLRGWAVPDDENQANEGYLVEYVGSEPNLKGYDGYVSWSPKEQFETVYQPLDKMSFGHAIELLKDGQCVSRAGWNGKGMFLVLVRGEAVKEAIHERYKGEGEPLDVLNAIYMYTADKKLVPWLASQTDMLAEDWGVVVETGISEFMD